MESKKRYEKEREESEKRNTQKGLEVTLQLWQICFRASRNLLWRSVYHHLVLFNWLSGSSSNAAWS